jgi:DNA-binding MarR family transcriptional regulator
MFRVIKYRNVSGKIQATIETDDQTVGDFIRFFGSINKFVDLFTYRIRSAKSFDLYQKTAPHKMALLKKEFAEQLARFRSMPGTRIERMRILKEIRVSNGEQVPLDRIEAEIRRAIQYEKEDNLQKIKKLSDSGKSSKEISIHLGMPKSTVVRYLKKLTPPENPPEEDSRSENVVPLKGA